MEVEDREDFSAGSDHFAVARQLILHIGDCVLTLGPDSDTADARIVFEMKEDASLQSNREASFGVFVHSQRTAHSSLINLQRYGTDVVVVWNPEDPASDVNLSAAISIVKALARAKPISTSPVDVDALDKAILEIEGLFEILDQMRKRAKTNMSAAEDVLGLAEQVRGILVKQIAALNEQALALREFVG